jgi:hypothetical protein
MVSKVDRTVDYRDFKKKNATVATTVVDCRFFVDFAMDFSSDFSGKTAEEFVQNGLKIFKNFRQSQQSRVD